MHCIPGFGLIFLHNASFFTGIGFISLFILTAFITAWSGWHATFKRIWEAYSLFMIPGLILIAVLIVGLWTGAHHLYHWGDAEARVADKLLAKKASFLNPSWYTFGTLIIVGTWIFFAIKLRSLSLEEGMSGTADHKIHKRIRVWSAAFLPLAAFSSAAYYLAMVNVGGLSLV